MKFVTFFAATAMIAMTACNSGTAEQSSKDSVPATPVKPVEEIPVEDGPPPVTGVVQEVIVGKDGYTAKIKTAQDSVFYATISMSNLNDHMQFRTTKPGDTLHISGERWQMEDQIQITVRELK